MLMKLLKHEFRATGRVMVPLFAAMLVVSALSNLAVRYLDFADNWFFKTLSVIIIVLFTVGILSLCVVSVVLSVNRFRQSVLGDEGYLTLTLPVSIHSVVWSKIITSAVWFLLSGIVAIASVYILVFDVEIVKSTAEVISQLFHYFVREPSVEKVNWLLIILEAFADLMIGLCIAALAFYAALSVGHGFARHKMILSVVAFFAISIILSTVSSVVMNFLDEVNFLRFTNGMSRVGVMHTTFLLSALYLLIEGAVYYVITVFNLKRRLDLE